MNSKDCSSMSSLTPQQALDRLIEGNKRFVDGKMIQYDFVQRRRELAHCQHPFATVICCSDSRAPPEFTFNVNMGDLFVVRTAGGVIGDRELGSVEYAVEHLHTPLIVVMSHTSCGACTAACEHAASEGPLSSIINELAPISKVCNDNISETCRLNAVVHAKQLQKMPELIPYIERGQCRVVGMELDIETGVCTMVKE